MHPSAAARYAEFAAREARGVSPSYERLADAVSRNDELLGLIGTLPEAKQQPNLFFGVVRLLGGPVGDPAAFHDYVTAHWPAIATEMRARATQTNEPGRCAVLLPVLATLPQPLALLEVGASAGLCLYPDRYAYRYGDHTVGSGEPVLECTLTGMAPPERVPRVVWRAGLDLNPLRVTDPADVAWLDALIWPEHEHRRARLRAAAAIAAADPPLLVRGDLAADLPALAAQAPAGGHARGVPHGRALSGSGAAADGVPRSGPAAAGTLDRQRGGRGVAARRAAAGAFPGAAQRAVAGRRTVRVDPLPRAGNGPNPLAGPIAPEERNPIGRTKSHVSASDRRPLWTDCSGMAGNCPLRQHHHTHRPLGQSAAERHEAAARGTWSAAAEVNLLGGTDPALPRTGWTAAADSQETVKENGAAATGAFSDIATAQTTTFDPRIARYVRRGTCA